MKVLANDNGNFILKGQHSCWITPDVGVYDLYIKVIEGKIRVNHGCYTPDGGTWLDSPDRNRIAHYNLYEKREYKLCLDIRTRFEKKDIIDIVNIQFFKEAVFEYAIVKQNVQ
nr:hypothetical protein [uncultured Blautia sp.]